MAAVVAILLAAGESTRMGRPKPLLPWDMRMLVEWQIEELRAAGAGRVIVVLGSYAEEVEPFVRRAGGEPVLNASYQTGRASSLRAGAGAIEAAAAVLILNVDQPRPAWVSRRLIARWEETAAKLVVPGFEGRRGHPVLADGSLIADLREVDDKSLGLRAVLDRYRAETELVPVQNSVVIVDLNTPEDYVAALAAFNRGAWAES